MGIGCVISAPLRAVQRGAGKLADYFATEGPPSKPSSKPSPRSRSSSELIRALRHRRAKPRIEATLQIIETRRFDLVPELVVVARDRRPAVRRAALDALSSLAPDRFVTAALTASKEMSREVVLTDLDALLVQISGPKPRTEL